MTRRIDPDGLLCPVCGEPLAGGEGALFCGRGHSFDIASAGYCNLLRPGKRNNSRAGDDGDMVAARGEFLSAGYYEPLLDAAADFLMQSGGLFIDAGCGEGYYTNGALLKCADLSAIGIDASKYAAAAAAKGARRLGVADRARYITASLSRMPVADGIADSVLSLFAPCDYGEFARVLRRGGRVVIGSAGARHLDGLKRIVYGEDGARENAPIMHAALAGGAFCEVKKKNVAYEAVIEGRGRIAALFGMTPYKWRSPEAGARALLASDRFATLVEVDFTVLEKL